MTYIELIGFFAAACTTGAFVPQAIKTVKTKHTKDISLGMFVLTTIGVTSWFIYGLLIESYPIIIANIITLVLALTILRYKLVYK